MKFFTTAFIIALPLLAAARPLGEAELADAGLERRTLDLNLFKTATAGAGKKIAQDIGEEKIKPEAAENGIKNALGRVTGEEQVVRAGVHTSTSSGLLPNSAFHVTTAGKKPGDTTTTQRHTGVTEAGDLTGEVADFAGRPNKGKEKVKPFATNTAPTVQEAIDDGKNQLAENKANRAKASRPNRSNSLPLPKKGGRRGSII